MLKMITKLLAYFLIVFVWLLPFMVMISPSIALLLAGVGALGVIFILSFISEGIEHQRHPILQNTPEGLEKMTNFRVRLMVVSHPEPKIWISRGLFSKGTLFITKGAIIQGTSQELSARVEKAMKDIRKKITIANSIGILLERVVEKTLPESISRMRVWHAPWVFFVWPWLRLLQGIRKDDEYGSTT